MQSITLADLFPRSYCRLQHLSMKGDVSSVRIRSVFLHGYFIFFYENKETLGSYGKLVGKSCPQLCTVEEVISWRARQNDLAGCRPNSQCTDISYLRI